jgi:hypothetical protein
MDAAKRCRKYISGSAPESPDPIVDSIISLRPMTGPEGMGIAITGTNFSTMYPAK